MCCYKYFLDGSFCGTWSLGVEQVGNCEFVAEPWWHGTVTSTGLGRGTSTPQGQSGGLSLCKPRSSSYDCGWQPQRTSSPPPPPHPLVSLLLIENSCLWKRMLISSGQSYHAFQTPWQLWFCFPLSQCMRIIFRAFPIGKPSFFFSIQIVVVLEMFGFCNKAFGGHCENMNC